MRVCIFSQNNPGVYSGGRYHALMLAEALAIAGHEVIYVTNALPVFFKDFEDFAAHDKIKTTITPNFLIDLSGEKIDAVFVTPGRSDHPVYYNAARMAAMWSGAQLFLINFESGNWFNSLAPQPRDLAEWDHWKRAIEHGATVLSSAQESDRWARKFYTHNTDKTRFAVWSPSINSAAADIAEDGFKEQRAVIISRLSDPHKGLQSILEILPDEMAGWTLTIISGTPEVNEGFLSDLRKMAGQRGITLDFLFRPDDIQKFEELKRARILIFPSLFEGYGYPPIEALYCNTEVVSYDLPVVMETCGDAPYYAPHGDRAALREALKRAILDPLAGERDHHTAIRDLAHIDSAAQRLVELLETETAEQNRTTNFSLTATEASSTQSVKDMLPDPVRQFLAKQKIRLKRLTTVAGRQSYMKRIGLVGASARGHERKLKISETIVDEMGVLTVRGWRLGGEQADAIEVQIGNKLVIPGKLGMNRPDLLKSYPQYKDGKAGFEISGRFIDEDLLGEPAEILFYKGKDLIDRVGTIVAAAPNSAVTWLNQDASAARSAKGTSLAIIADLDQIKTGSLGHYDLANIANAAKYADLFTTLVVKGDEATIQPYRANLNTMFNEVILADTSKPAQKPHKTAHLGPDLIAVEKALEDVQQSRILAGMIVIGVELAPALDLAQQGAHRLVYTLEALSGNAALPANTVIVSPSVEILNASAPALTAHDQIHLQLHQSAFGEPMEPIFGNIEIVIPASANPEALQQAHDFAETLGQQHSLVKATVRILGLTGQEALEPIAHNKISIEQMAPAFDNDLLYGNATVIVAPYFTDLTDQDRATLERTLLEAAAFNRPILAASSLGTELLTRCEAVSCASVDTMIEGLLAIVDETPDGKALLDTAGFGHASKSPSQAYGEFASVLGVQIAPPSVLKAYAQDKRVKHAVRGLIDLNPALRAHAEVRVMLGPDLAAGNTVIAALRDLKIAITGFHSRRPQDIIGLLEENREINLPIEAAEPYVLATLDPDEAKGWEALISRLDGTSVSLIPIIRRQDAAALNTLKTSANDREIAIFGGYNSKEWSKSTRDLTVRIATESFVLDPGVPKWVLQKLDLMVTARPELSAAATERLLAAIPEASVIGAAPGGGLHDHISGRIIRMNPSSPPWSDEFLATIEAVEGDDDSLKAARQIAAWMGGRVITSSMVKAEVA